MSSNPTVAIIIKTLLREGCIEKLIESVEKYCDTDYRFYIYDESPLPLGRDLFYQNLASKGHYIFVDESRERISVTKARNHLISVLLDEVYILRIDDDFLFYSETFISKMVSILNENLHIGALADVEIQARSGKGTKKGALSPSQGFFFKVNQYLLKLQIPVSFWQWKTTSSGIRYAFADHTRNFLMIRREVFNTISWNNKLIIDGEHSDFMLQLKNSFWLLAFTPDSRHVHADPAYAEVSSVYKTARNNSYSKQVMIDTYKLIWGVASIVTINISYLYYFALIMSKARKTLSRFK